VRINNGYRRKRNGKSSRSMMPFNPGRSLVKIRGLGGPLNSASSRGAFLGDKADPPNYVGFRRDSVELDMQFQFEHEMGTIRLRFLAEDPDALFSE
jgi:hypothetical protein